MMTKKNAIRNNIKLLKKTLTVILAGVFLFTNTLSWAKEEELFSTAIENEASSSSPTKNNKLAPSSRLNNEDFKISLTVAAICNHIEHDGNLDDKSYLNNVLARLDAGKNPNIVVLPYEIIIEIPNENLAVRYFDPTQANVVTPYSDVSKLETKVIGPRLNRQIIYRTKALERKGDKTTFPVPSKRTLPKVGIKAESLELIKSLGIRCPDYTVLNSDEAENILENPEKISSSVKHILESLGITFRQGFFYSKDGRKIKLAVRSSPYISMPGILETVLDISTLETLKNALLKVAASWNEPQRHRYMEGLGIIDENYRQGIIVQEMIYGNKNNNSGAGVAFSCNPNTGEQDMYGCFKIGAQGIDIVRGNISGSPLAQLNNKFPNIYDEVKQILAKLEKAKRFPQEIEFTIEDGVLYILQTRNAELSSQAEIIYLNNSVKEGINKEAQIIPRVIELQREVKAKRLYKVRKGIRREVLFKSLDSTYGAIAGKAVFSLEKARELAAKNEPVILIVSENMREDIILHIKDIPNIGVVTLYGNGASHEAVITRSAGISALIGVEDAETKGSYLYYKGEKILSEYDFIVVDANNKECFRTKDKDILEEDRIVYDYTYGIDLVTYERDFTAQHEAENYDALIALYVQKDREFREKNKSKDKKGSFISNVEKHFIHRLLIKKGQSLGKSVDDVMSDLTAILFDADLQQRPRTSDDNKVKDEIGGVSKLEETLIKLGLSSEETDAEIKILVPIISYTEKVPRKIIAGSGGFNNPDKNREYTPRGYSLKPSAIIQRDIDEQIIAPTLQRLSNWDNTDEIVAYIRYYLTLKSLLKDKYKCILIHGQEEPAFHDDATYHYDTYGIVVVVEKKIAGPRLSQVKEEIVTKIYEAASQIKGREILPKETHQNSNGTASKSLTEIKETLSKMNISFRIIDENRTELWFPTIKSNREESKSSEQKNRYSVPEYFVGSYDDRLAVPKVTDMPMNLVQKINIEDKIRELKEWEGGNELLDYIKYYLRLKESLGNKCNIILDYVGFNCGLDFHMFVAYLHELYGIRIIIDRNITEKPLETSLKEIIESINGMEFQEKGIMQLYGEYVEKVRSIKIIKGMVAGNLAQLKEGLYFIANEIFQKNHQGKNPRYDEIMGRIKELKHESRTSVPGVDYRKIIYRGGVITILYTADDGRQYPIRILKCTHPKSEGIQRFEIGNGYAIEIKSGYDWSFMQLATSALDKVKEDICQKGKVVDLRQNPYYEGKKIVLVSDLHGMPNNLEEILKNAGWYEKDGSEKAGDELPVLVILGDAVHISEQILSVQGLNRPKEADYGTHDEYVAALEKYETEFNKMDDSIKLMRRIFELKTKYPQNIFYVIGNHDNPHFFKTNKPVSQNTALQIALLEQMGCEGLRPYIDFLDASPLLFIAKGIVASHGGPVKGSALIALRKKAEENNISILDQLKKEKLDLETVDPNEEEEKMVFRNGKWGSPDIDNLVTQLTLNMHRFYIPNINLLYTEQEVADFLEAIGSHDAMFVVGHDHDFNREPEHNGVVKEINNRRKRYRIREEITRRGDLSQIYEIKGTKVVETTNGKEVGLNTEEKIEQFCKDNNISLDGVQPYEAVYNPIPDQNKLSFFAKVFNGHFIIFSGGGKAGYRVFDTLTKQITPSSVEILSMYITENKLLFKDALGEGKQDILLRVPIEAIESIGVDNIKDFLTTFQKAPNGYVELYYMSGIGEASESVYQRYGIEKKLLSEELKNPEKRTRKNTLTLFPVLKDEKLDQASIVSRIGNMKPKNTILSPIGLQNDSAGLIRSTILGLKIMEVAREGEKIDKDEVQRRVLEDLKMICKIDDMRGLTADDIIYLAISDDINKIMEALKKLIRLLPITPIDAEELRQIYEHAKQALIAA